MCKVNEVSLAASVNNDFHIGLRQDVLDWLVNRQKKLVEKFGIKDKRIAAFIVLDDVIADQKTIRYNADLARFFVLGEFFYFGSSISRLTKSNTCCCCRVRSVSSLYCSIFEITVNIIRRNRKTSQRSASLSAKTGFTSW